MANDPFTGRPIPEKPKLDPETVAQTRKVGDWFTLRVTEVGPAFTNDNGATTFTLTGELVAASLRDHEQDDGTVVKAPKVGTEAIKFFTVTNVYKNDKTGDTRVVDSRDYRTFKETLKAAGVTTVEPGDLYSEKLVKIEAPGKFAKGPRIRDFILDTSNRQSSDDAFDGEEPF